MRRSRGTEMEPCFLLPLGKTSWPSKAGLAHEDRATTMDIEMQPPRPLSSKVDQKDSQQSSVTNLNPPEFQR